MVKKGGSSRKLPSHQDLVKTVSKQLKYYFEIKRQEDGFDLSGPDCPRPDYPALKSRPMLLYEGLHDRSVKHFYSDQTVKQRITHMPTYDDQTEEAKRMQKLMKKTMDRVSYVPTPLLDFIDRVYHNKPPWMGVGMEIGNTKYTKNSEKYVTGSLNEWQMKPKKHRCKGYGNPEPTLKRAFTEPPGAKPRLRRSCPSGWIDNKECNRLVNGASRILASSEFREGMTSRPQSSKSTSLRSSPPSLTRARSASPQATRSRETAHSTTSSQQRLTHRPQSGRNTIVQKRGKSQKITYHDAKDIVVEDHERKKTSQNLKKGKIYYDIDGRRKAVPHKIKNDNGYLERSENTEPHRIPDAESSEEKVPDWLRNQMRKQDVEEKKMPYNSSVQPVEVVEPHTARSEDVSKREGVRRRPKSAKRSKGRSSRFEKDRTSQVTLSEGTYEEVRLTDESESEEDAYYEDRGCQTGWELFVQYDQSDNILYDGETEVTKYKIVVHTGGSVGASTKAPIKIILYGTRGRSPDIELFKCENHKISFQQSARDVFYISCSYVGTLSKIQIGHDSEAEAWFLDSVSVHDPTKGEIYEFLCKKWLSVKAEDKMTRRQLEISATRKLEPDSKSDEEDDEEEEDAIKRVAQTNSPRASIVGSKSGSSTITQVSTSHLRNNTETTPGSEAKPQSLISLPSETASTTSLETKNTKKIRLQEPFVSRHGDDYRRRRSPDVAEDFESDITLHSGKKSVSSRQSEPSIADSESHTARFEEQSIISQTTLEEEGKHRHDLDRLDAFKAGQKAERERQRLEEGKQQLAKTESRTNILQGINIHEAAKNGNLARIKELLDHDGELKNSLDGRGNTPLHLATAQGQKEVVQFLAATGADLDYRDQAGYEPTHMAALHGHVNCLMVLIAMGASINSRTDDCKTPLHLAAMSGNMQTCKWLVANRSRLNVEDDFGRTPVDMADNNGHNDVANFLRTCINEIQGKPTSLESLLIGKDDGVGWKDDQAERPIVYHNKVGSDTEDGESLADLRRGAKEREEKDAKQRAYQDMQKKLSDGNMTYLDRIRYEVDNS